MTDNPQTCAGLNCTRPTRNILCERCVRITEQRLGDIPALVDALEETITRQSRSSTGSGHRKKGDEQPLPFNEAASKKRSLVNLLIEWADAVAAWQEVPGVPLRANTVYADTERARAAVAILLKQLRWFRVHPEAGKAAEAIWNIRDGLRAAVDRPPERLSAGPCHADVPYTVEEDGAGGYRIVEKPGKCELQLWRKWGSDTITCDGWHDPLGLPGCGATYTLAERDEFLLKAIETTLLPLRAVWEALHKLMPDRDVPDWGTVKKWPKGREERRTDAKGKVRVVRVPPRLVARSINLDGKELFLGADILRLVRDDAKRRGRRRNRTRRGKATA